MKISAVFTKKKPVYNMGYKRAAGERRTIAPSEKYLIASGAAVVLGLAAGALLFRTNSGFFSRGIGEYFLSFSTDFSAKSFPEIFSGFFCANLIYLLVNLILGTSAVGDVPVFFAAFLKSAGIGSLASYLFVKSALKGVEYFLLVVFPEKLS